MDFSQKMYRRIILGTAVVGLLTSIYLTVAKLANSKEMCIEGFGDCWSVNNSIYSELFGIPIAVFGAGAYLAIIALVMLENRSTFWGEYAPLMLFGVTLVGILFSAYLTYVEVAILQAICPFCVISAIAMLILFVLAIGRLVKAQANTNPW